MSTVTQTQDRFEISVDDKVAGAALFLDRDGRRIFFHTEVGEEYGGQGLGGQLVGQAVQQTVDAGLTVVPVCPFVGSYLKKHDEHTEHAQPPTADDLQALDDRS